MRESAVFTTAMSSISIAVAAQTTVSVQRCEFISLKGSVGKGGKRGWVAHDSPGDPPPPQPCNPASPGAAATALPGAAASTSGAGRSNPGPAVADYPRRIASLPSFHRGGAGPPLMLIHGFVDCWRTWDLVLP